MAENSKVKLFGTHNYYVYITTNVDKTVLYVGVTNDLARRLFEHERDSVEKKSHFAGKYNCIYLVYWERFPEITLAIDREKQIKGWTRAKKDALIATMNPEWKFLNEELK